MAVAGVIGYEPQKRPPRFLGRRHQPPCRGHVTGDGPVGTFRQFGGRHLVSRRENMGVGGVIVSRFQREDIRFGYSGFFCEFSPEVAFGMIQRHVVKAETDAQCEHVFAFVRRFHVESRFGQRVFGHGRDRGAYDVVVRDPEFGERIERFETGSFHGGFRETVGVHDDRGPFLEPFAVGAQGHRVHRYEQVAVIAGSKHFFAADMYLESGNSGQGTLRGADFGRKIGERRNAVAPQGRSVAEKRPRQLHAVTRIA